MTDIDRHERVRADWLLAHEASWHLSDRRMATELKRRAARRERSAAGAAESSHHEGRIRHLHARFIAAGEDSKETAARAALMYLGIMPVLALTIGPALGLSYGAYVSTTERALRRGSVPIRRPWLIAAALVAAAGVVASLLFRSLVTVATLRYYPEHTVDIQWFNVALIYGWSQLTLGLALVAWQVRRHGWPGVTIVAAPAVPQAPAVPEALQVPNVPTATNGPATPVPPLVPSLPVPDDAPFALVLADEDPTTSDHPTHEGDAA